MYKNVLCFILGLNYFKKGLTRTKKRLNYIKNPEYKIYKFYFFKKQN